jgi:acetyl esterase/lipase
MAMPVTEASGAPVAPAPSAATPMGVAPSPTPVPTAEPAGESILLWPEGAPGAQKVTARETFLERAPNGPLRDRIAEHVTRPNLTLFHPGGAANGVTLLIVPGGGYVRVVIDKEGFESAEWFAARGFECAVLRYRMPADGWEAGTDAPVHDVMRAIRLLRSQRAARGARLGVIGFSAGGHAVARAITDSAAAYARTDAADDLSARPDFAVLMYPVIATTGASAHAGSVAQILASGVPAAELDRLSPDFRVSTNTPPTLLVHAADDHGVPVENSLRMFAALREHGVRSALHVFESGGHGFGMRGVTGKDSAAWPGLVSDWALAARHE